MKCPRCKTVVTKKYYRGVECLMEKPLKAGNGWVVPNPHTCRDKKNDSGKESGDSNENSVQP